MYDGNYSPPISLSTSTNNLRIFEIGVDFDLNPLHTHVICFLFRNKCMNYLFSRFNTKQS